jgi:H+/Cl- antiporter ClcA
VALVVEVAWSRWILNGTANLLQNPWPMGLDNTFFNDFIFAIFVGILIGIASILLITIVHRSSKDFFKKSEQKFNEL